jgi:hypothetical protein
VIYRNRGLYLSVLIGIPFTAPAIAVIWCLAPEPPPWWVALAAVAVTVGALWVMYWRPRMEVSDSGVRVIGTLTNRFLTWGDIDHFDATTHLEIHLTCGGALVAFGLPASGVKRLRGHKGEVDRLADTLNQRICPDIRHALVLDTAGRAAKVREAFWLSLSVGVAILILGLVLTW